MYRVNAGTLGANDEDYTVRNRWIALDCKRVPVLSNLGTFRSGACKISWEGVKCASANYRAADAQRCEIRVGASQAPSYANIGQFDTRTAVAREVREPMLPIIKSLMIGGHSEAYRSLTDAWTCTAEGEIPSNVQTYASTSHTPINLCQINIFRYLTYNMELKMIIWAFTSMQKHSSAFLAQEY